MRFSGSDLITNQRRLRLGPVGGQPCGILPAPNLFACVSRAAALSLLDAPLEAVSFFVFQLSVNESKGCADGVPVNGQAKYSKSTFVPSIVKRPNPPSVSLYASSRTPCMSVSKGTFIGPLFLEGSRWS